MQNAPTTLLSGWLSVILTMLQREGLSAESLCAKLKLQTEHLYLPEARYDQDDITRLWEEAVRITENPAIGLKTGDVAQPELLGAFGQSLQASENLLEAYTRLCTYQKVLGDGADLKQEVTEDKYLLYIDLNGDKIPTRPQSIDGIMAAVVGGGKVITQRDLIPIQVDLKHKVQNEKPYREFYRCPVNFGKSENRLVLAKADIVKPIPTSNQNALQEHDNTVANYLAKIKNQTFVEQVKSCIAKNLPQGEPKLEQVAEYFQLSRRKFQRTLKKESATFLELLDEVRKDLAKEYVCNPNVGLKPTAYLLGFTEPSNFYRAFKRWYGMTPSQYQEQLNSSEVA